MGEASIPPATSWPATRTSPPSAWTSVDMICTVVVLPAPLGPSSENVVPRADLQVDSVGDGLAAE
jgi:hypothetical protein